MPLDPMVEINSRHIINRGKTLGVKGVIKEIREKKQEKEFHFFLPPSNPLDLMC